MGEHLIVVSDDDLDEILNEVRTRDHPPEFKTFRAGLIAGAEHYDRLLREKIHE